MTFYEQIVLALSFMLSVLSVYVAGMAASRDAARRRDVAALQAQSDGLISSMERQGQVVDSVLDAIDAIRGQQ